MTRRECLDKAAECVLQDRASQYGGVEDNFARIARLWFVYTGTVLDGIDVAMMMALLKIARIRGNKAHADSFVDLAGYAACGAELAGAEKAREDATRKWGAEYKKLRSKAEGDAKAEDCEELVEKDAPQTLEEVCQRIMDANPEIYKRRDPWEGLTRLNFKPPFELHKATGEELAEMAEEEEKHG